MGQEKLDRPLLETDKNDFKKCIRDSWAVRWDDEREQATLRDLDGFHPSYTISYRRVLEIIKEYFENW